MIVIVKKSFKLEDVIAFYTRSDDQEMRLCYETSEPRDIIMTPLVVLAADPALGLLAELLLVFGKSPSSSAQSSLVTP